MKQRQSPDSVVHEPSTPVVTKKPYDDGYSWRKYGQKNVRANKYARSYFRCSHRSCLVKKQVECSQDGKVTHVYYFGNHDHPKPQYKLSVVFTTKVEDIELKDANEDMDRNENLTPKRRKKSTDDVSCLVDKLAIESRVVVRTVSAVDAVNDGYRWRKYGQKLVKGNSNPRSYYRCSNASCPAKKHVERSAHDSKVVIAVYEGQHYHDLPPARTTPSHTVSVAATSQNGSIGTKPVETVVKERASMCKHEKFSVKEEAKEQDPPAAVDRVTDSRSSPGNLSNEQETPEALCMVSGLVFKPKVEQISNAVLSSTCPETKSNIVLSNVKMEPVVGW